MKIPKHSFPALDHAALAEERRTTEILRELEALGASRCFRCARPLCYHEYVLSVATGFKTSPHCAACLADGLGRSPTEFLADAYNSIRHQTCYYSGWQWASRRENQPIERPDCLWSGRATHGKTETAPFAAGTLADPTDCWDAGNMACGELVLKLRLRLKVLQPSDILLLTARDPGAAADIPAWCKLTGHGLLKADHPRYWIQRKDG